jgi:hypothetical protein
MKPLLSILVFLIFVNYSFAQDSKNISGIYSSSDFKKGMSCISLNDGIAYIVNFSSGSFNEVSEHNYVIIHDTIKISKYMDFYLRNNTLYWFNQRNEAVLKGGLKKANNKVTKKMQKKYGAQLKTYNLIINNGLIEKIAPPDGRSLSK